MVDRLLSMLNQYLVSNKTLQLDNTFKVYLKILSSQHSAIKHSAMKIGKKKKKKGYGRLHVGCSENESKFKWAIDVPQHSSWFKNKCLLVSTILGLSQHDFYKSKCKDFLYMTYVQSKNYKKQTYALKLLKDKLFELSDLTKLPDDGPYHLTSTIKILSRIYNCQFFIFEGLLKNGSHLVIRYPSNFDCSLKPIFLFKKFNSSHIIFIRNIDSFFKEFGKTCLVCKKVFRSRVYKHFCKERPSCFACHNFLMMETTFYHSKLNYFCDSKISKTEPVLCNICNVTLSSNLCKLAHKRLCNSKGFFGYKCLSCQKFTYKYNNYNSQQIKELHKCNHAALCKICHQINDSDHLCKLKIETSPKFHSRLGFLNVLFVYDTFKNSFSFDEPFAIAINLEDISRQSFTEYILSSFQTITVTENISFSYYPSNLETPKFKPFSEEVIQRKISSLQVNKNTLDSIESIFINTLLSKPFFNTTFIVQDQDNFVMVFLLRLFSQYGICPEILKRNNSIILLELKDCGIRFLPSNNYIQGDEYSLADQFDIHYTKYFFPVQLLQHENINYYSNIPEKTYFQTDSINQEALDNFYEDQKDSKWNFQKELLTFLKQKSFLFVLAMLKFLNEFFIFQLSLDCKINVLFHPFNQPNITVGGAIFRLFKIMFLKNIPIHVVANESGKQGKYVSRLEHEYISYLEFKEPEKNYLSAFNNPKGQKYFKEAYPDAYSEKTGEVVMVLGCYFHCCLKPSCNINKNCTKSTVHRNGKTFEANNKEREEQFLKLMANNSNINKITEIWECQIKQLKASNEHFKFFLDNHYVKIPLQRLIPRDCYRGAYTDNYFLKWTSFDNPDENLHFCDINGLYSYVAISKKFMIDRYIVLIGKSLQKLKIKDNKFYYENERVCGAVLLSILPPKNLIFPFLMYRTTSGRNCNTLCKLCCESRSQSCKHSDTQRALIGCYMLSEIEYALTLGYQIISIFESHIYLKQDFLFKAFIEKLNYFKTIYSDCFEDCKSKSEKQKCLDTLNRKLNLEGSSKLTLHCVKPNVGKRFFYKIAQNSFYGKFGQKTSMQKFIYVSDQNQLEKVIEEYQEINDVTVLNENFCCVNVTPKNLQKTSLTSNVYLSASITAFARIVVHKHLMHLSSIPTVKIFQVDCDSIIFSIPKTMQIPIEISAAVGDFKHEIKGTILTYFSLGAKNYMLTYVTKSNEVKTIHKISGLKLVSQQTKDFLNPDFYNSLLEQLKHNFYVQTEVPNRKAKLDLKTLTFRDFTQTFTISNNINVQRNLIFNNDQFFTFPFGYDVNLM